MKRKIDIIILLLCMVLTSGCVWESYAPEEGKGDANIGMELSTYAVNSGDANALEHELIIKKAYVFIYNAAGVLENAGKTKVSTLTSTGEVIDAAKKLNATWRVIGGNKDIYVVVNPGRIMSERLEHPAIFSDKTTLENVVINEEAFAEDVSAFADSGMVMTTKISAFAVSSDTTVQAVVKRRHGRIDLSVRKAKDLEGATVIVKSVKLKKGQTHMTDLFDFADHLTGAGRHFEETKSMTDTVTAQQATAGSWSGTASDYTAITRFYTFEYHKNGPTDTLSACLEMTVSVNGVDKVIPVYICTTAQGANQTGNDANKPVWVKANTIYRVMATLTKGTVDVALNILDWNDQPINGDIPGTTLNVSKSKIVMDWWNLGKSFSTNFSFNSDGKVSLDGYYSNGSKLTTLPTWLSITEPTLPAQTGTFTLTYTPTSGTDTGENDGLHPDVEFWLKAGNIIKKITVVYDNGLIPTDKLPAAWTNNRPDIGLHVAKRGNLLPSQTAGTSDITMAWSTVFESVPSAQNANYGAGSTNTSAIINTLGTQSIAANACRALGDKWFLASEKEIITVFDNEKLLGSSYLFTNINGLFSSSTERTDATYYSAIVHSTKVSQQRNKVMSQSYVRAVCNMDSVYIMTGFDEAYIYGGAGEYEITDAFYAGNFTTGANSITVSGDAGVSISGITGLSSTKGIIKLRYTDDKAKESIINITLGGKTKQIAVHRKSAQDAHNCHVVYGGILTSLQWQLSDMTCTTLDNGDGTFSLNIPENVTPSRWVTYSDSGSEISSTESNPTAEPIFSERVSDGSFINGSSKIHLYIRQTKPMYVGWFGGTPNNSTGDTYFDRRLIIENVDEYDAQDYATGATPCFYTSNVATGSQDTERGKENTIYMMNKSDKINFQAAYECYMKNDVNGNGIIDAGESIEWYLPAVNQMMSVYINNNNLTAYPLWPPREFYNTSTESTTITGNTWYINGFWGNRLDSNNLNSCRTNATRCVRNL
ncbi:MAG: hypothetical protein PHD11_00545 [Bacteroidales bacterium]|nr:hypothetical protein [Bacteroidales bacterium]